MPAGLERVQLLKQDRRLIAGYAADYHVMAVAGGRDLNDASRNATWSWAYDAVIGERDWDEIAAQAAREFVLH